MRTITLEELASLAKGSKSSIDNSAKKYDRKSKIYIHKTYGDYNTTYNDYHINILGDGSIILMNELFEQPNATKGRDAGSVAVAICGGYGAEKYELINNIDEGDYPIKDNQVDRLASVLEVLATNLEIPVGINRILTHAEAADNKDRDNRFHEPYGPDSDQEDKCYDLVVIHDLDFWYSAGDIIRSTIIQKRYSTEGK